MSGSPGTGSRRRVLHVLPDLRLGGGQAVVLLLARYRQSFDVDIAYLDPPADMEAAFADAGSRPIFLDRPGRRSPAVVADLARTIRRRSVDVVHVHSGPDRKYGQAAALVAGRPVVAHFHSAWDHRGQQAAPTAGFPTRVSGAIKGWGRDWIERRTVRAGIAVGDAVQRAQAPLSHVPVQLVPNGIDVVAFGSATHPGTDVTGSANGPVLVCVGRLAAGKGQDRLIRLLAHLPSPSHLLLVGDGEQRVKLERLATDAGVAERVTFAGDRHDVARLLAGSDVFVFASESEGLPLAVLEAMAAAVPIVAFDLPGLRRVITDGVSGFLVPQDDDQGFVDNVRRLVADRSLRRRVGAEARNVVLERFDARVMARAVESIYTTVLDGGHRIGKNTS